MFHIELSPDCQAQRGYSHGMTVPAVRFECRVSSQGVVDLKAVSLVLAHHFGLPASNRPITTNVDNASPAVLALACRLALRFMHNALLPLPDDFNIVAKEQRFWVCLPYIRHQASIVAFYMAVEALNAVAKLNDDSNNLPALQLERIQRGIGIRLEPYQEPGQNRRYFIQAALKNAVPWVRNGSAYLTFGSGQFARRMASTFTDNISPIAAAIVKDKAQCAQWLRQCGLPGANNHAVYSQAHLLEVAQALGYPLVIKPADLDQGAGVFADIRSEEVLLWAYHEALKHSSNVLLEQHVEGDVYRFTLYNGAAASITRKLPGGVVGDGESSIAELLERGVPAAVALGLKPGDAYQKPLAVDQEALNLLAQYGLTAESVPLAQQFVPLRRKTNAFAGGITLPVVADTVHPDNLALAAEAALRCGVDVAGVDLIMSDISQSWRHSTALICEVNAQPQVGPEAAEKILLWYLADGLCIEVDILLYEPLEPLSANEICHYGQQLEHDYVCCATGLYWQGGFLSGPFNSGFDAACSALQDRRATSLLCVLSAAELLRHGLPVSRVRHIYSMPGNDHKSPDYQRLKTEFAAHLTGQFLVFKKAVKLSAKEYSHE